MMSYQRRYRNLYGAGKHIGQMCFFALFAVLVLVLTETGSRKVYAQEQPTVVKAGFFENGDFMHKTEDGSYEGYDIDYYYTIAGYTGWKIEFVE